MDESANGSEPLTWYERILLEVADTLIDSPDISQALAQAQTDSSVLRNMVVTNSELLMTSGITPSLSFHQRVVPELIFLSRRSLRFTLITICTLVIFLLTLMLTDHSPANLIACSVLLFGIIAGTAICAGILLSHPQFEPIGTTRNDLRRELIGPFLREAINNILAQQEQPDVMRITSAPGLADLSDREQLVTTAAMKETLQLSASMSSGSIGISGPRGVGKTTLLRYFCDPLLSLGAPAGGGFRGFSDVRILISAPIEYNTKDFVLHLFGKLCEAIIGTSQDLNQNASYVQQRRKDHRFAGLLAACILVISGLALIACALTKPGHIPRLTRPELYLSAGALSLAVGIGIFIQWSKSIRFARMTSNQAVTIVGEAKAWLTRINYLQTLTSGYAGRVKIPAGLDLEITSGRQLSELELALPDLIDRYKSFAGRAIHSRQSNRNQLRESREQQEQYAWRLDNRAMLFHRMSEFLKNVPVLNLLAGLPGMLEEVTSHQAMLTRQTIAGVPKQYTLDNSPRIFIGIDEIDKIDADSAQRFLNDIKAIFGIPGCLYMVSVSDEALAVFEERVLLGRTAFDSSFDEVVRVSELDFESCRYLLRRRIAGMPDSLIAFCEIMSGGLPRDLIRTARSVVEANGSSQTRIGDLTLSIVNSQVEILKRTFIKEMSSEDYKVLGSRFMESLPEEGGRKDWAQSISIFLEEMKDTSLPTSFAAALYFYATITDVFSGKIPDSHDFFRSYRPEDTKWIDRLAQARNMISTNGDIARESIGSFRLNYGLSGVAKPSRTPRKRSPER